MNSSGMNLAGHLAAVGCVSMIALGQVLFKYAANELSVAGSFLSPRVAGFTGLALGVYAIATVVWILLLQTAPLSRLYPYMALSFVLVSAAGWLLFHERIAPVQLAGLGLIVAGLLFIAAS